MPLPKQAWSQDRIFEALGELTAADFDWRSGRCYAYTFDAGREAEAIAKRAFEELMSKNALDMTFFPSVLRLENAIMALAAEHLGGDADTVGSFTSGGTESILLAVKSARDYFRAVRPDIREPEIVLPATAHAAFHKAAHYFGLRKVVVPVDPLSFRADVSEMRKAITANTILLVGSAASYAHGVVDPIPELGQLALEHGLLLHVDGCIGGFLLPYFRRLGATFPDFDLQVPGVTSISMDLHKYAYAPKGASVVLYKSRVLRKHQAFACADWTGYTMINMTMQSTKSAGPLAGAWAVLHALGDDGYLEIARRLLEAKERLVAGIRALPAYRVLGDPDLPLIAFTSKEKNVFQVIDAMNARGWYVQPQLRMGAYPENIHLSVNPSNVPHTDALLADLADVTAQVTAKPRGAVARSVAAMAGSLDPTDLDDALFEKLLSMAGIGEVGVPEGTANINDILNELPPPLAERVLVEYVNRLFRFPDSATLPTPESPWTPVLGTDPSTVPGSAPRSHPGRGRFQSPINLATHLGLALLRHLPDQVPTLLTQAISSLSDKRQE